MIESSDERAWVAETRFSGVIAELRLPRETIRAILPADLRLHSDMGGRRGYPLLLAFGDHAASAVHLSALQVRTGVTFHEVLFGVPCVVVASRTPVLFVPLMYCDEPVSTWSGNALYGFNKRMASMEWLGDSFVATDEGGRVVLRVVMEASAAAPSRAPRLVEKARLPVVGRRRDGSYVTSRFHWDWDTAQVRRARLLVDLDYALAPRSTNVFVPSRNAIHVRALGWRITWPEFHLAPELRDASRT